MVFSKKWLRNHPKFLLHFLMYFSYVESLSRFRQIFFELLASKMTGDDDDTFLGVRGKDQQRHA